MSVNSFGKRLAQLRKARGYSQVRFAEAIRVSKSAVGMWETGDREPDNETLQKVADFFDVSIDYLLGRVDNPQQILSEGVRLFVDSLELTDEEIIENIKLTVDGRELTPEEAKRFIAFVRAERSMRNN